MPIIEPDTSEVKEYTPLDPGVYVAKIVACEFKTSKSGNPMIVPEFEITSGGGTRKKRSYLVITGQGAYGFDSLLRSVGFTEQADKMKAGEKVPFDTDDLIGLSCNLQMDQEAYNGQMQDVIKGYLPA